MPREIARYKTAISRTDLSRPIKTALSDGILSPGVGVFDYGCGRGDDLKRLDRLGIHGFGWDPVHRPNDPLKKSSVVNLGYVINVIENLSERQAALKLAWSLAQDVLVVSARLTVESPFASVPEDYSDGFLTQRGTFQKFFDQEELRDWIDRTLGAVSVPAAPGVFYVFRNELARAMFVASRYRRRLTVPQLPRSAELLRQHEELLQELTSFASERGRLPADDELSNAADICRVFGSIRRAFRVISSGTVKELWAEITRKRREDLIIYLALSRFGGRPSFGRLSRVLQGDVKGLFGNYKSACESADALLYSLGRPGVTDRLRKTQRLGSTRPPHSTSMKARLAQCLPSSAF